jgi:hypothetical protein
MQGIWADFFSDTHFKYLSNFGVTDVLQEMVGQFTAYKKTFRVLYARLGNCTIGSYPNWQTLGTSTPTIPLNSFVVSPNPATNIVSIRQEGQLLSSIVGTCTIVDLSGRVVISTSYVSSSTKEIDVSALPKGLYLITVATEFGKYTEKLVIE